MVATEPEKLVATINECVAIRGIYLVMDERLELVCGPGTLQHLDDPKVTQKMAEFAAAHGWHITRYQQGFAFVTASAVVPPLKEK